MKAPLFYSKSFLAAVAVCSAVVLIPLALATPVYIQTLPVSFSSTLSTIYGFKIGDDGVGYAIGAGNTRIESLNANGNSVTFFSPSPNLATATDRDFVLSGSTIYMAYTNGALSRVVKRQIDPGLFTVTHVATGSVTTGVMHIAMSPTGSLYVSRANKLFFMDRTTMTHSTSTTMTATPTTMVAVSDRAIYYVSSAGVLRFIDPTIGTGSDVQLATGIGTPLDIALDSHGKLYVATTSNNVKKFSTGGTLILTYAPIGGEAFGTIQAMTIHNNIMYVINSSRVIKTYDMGFEKPENVTATPSGHNITIDWTNTAVDASYVSTVIRRSTTGYPSFTGGTLVANTTDATYTDTNLASGPYYYYSVFNIYAGDARSEAATTSSGVEGDSDVCSPYAHFTFDTDTPLAEDVTGNDFTACKYRIYEYAQLHIQSHCVTSTHIVSTGPNGLHYLCVDQDNCHWQRQLSLD